jgi:5-methylcytosine-specific restriction endonuclease McrA
VASKKWNTRPGRSSSQLCRPTTRARIYARDNWSCVWCGPLIDGERRLTLDHVIPRAQGGSNRYWNLITACSTCNSRRKHLFVKSFGFEAPAVALRILQATTSELPPLPRKREAA